MVPALNAGTGARIILDGTLGYPSSFLEEAFGGLVRKGYTAKQVKDAFTIVAEQPSFKRFKAMIAEFIERAEASKTVA